jgi:hypothetical protein
MGPHEAVVPTWTFSGRGLYLKSPVLDRQNPSDLSCLLTNTYSDT